MSELHGSFFKSIGAFLVFGLVSFSAYSQAESIDMSPFADGANHWHRFFTDWDIIAPLPGNPLYEETEIVAIGDNILLFQRDNGGWAKNYDMQSILSEEQKEKIEAQKPVLHTTFDNATTYPHVDYLAQAYTITKLERFKEGCLKGLDFILEAQYDNGGWPQYYPPLPENSGYSKHITFNDEAYIGIMNVLKKIVDNDNNFSFLDDTYRSKVNIAYKKGLDCILKTQIVEDGVLKIWCQQHDEVTLQPAWARTFEPPSLCSDESAPIVLHLMSIENPSDKIVASIQSAVKWFDDSKILNTRCIYDPTAPEYVSKHRVHRYDTKVVYDLNAPPIWTRFYELNTGKSIFCDRSGEILYNMSDVGRERRSGYRWYVYAPQDVLDMYPAWQKRWAKDENVLSR